MTTIRAAAVIDLRFPTSRTLDGSDAMNPDPDYSAADLASDRRRLGIARCAIGSDTALAIDANQRWSVPEAIAAIDQLAQFDLRWVEEPTHPDDLVGHAAIAKAVHPVPIANGEHLANPTMAKQLLQLGGAQILQIDATRVAGVDRRLSRRIGTARTDPAAT